MEKLIGTPEQIEQAEPIRVKKNQEFMLYFNTCQHLMDGSDLKQMNKIFEGGYNLGELKQIWENILANHLSAAFWIEIENEKDSWVNLLFEEIIAIKIADNKSSYDLSPPESLPNDKLFPPEPLFDMSFPDKIEKKFEQMKKEQGEKYDDGKLRFDLLPLEPLEELIKVYMHGADKYGANNWRKGFNYSRIFSAIQRHLWAFWDGEDYDFDTGNSHLAHAAWGCFTLIEFLKMHPDLDDRILHKTEKEGN